MKKAVNYFEEIKNLDSDIKVVILSVFLFAVGYGSVMSYFPLLLRKLGATSSQVGFIYSTITASAALSALIGGMLLNKFDLRLFTTVVSAVIAPFALIMYFATDWRAGFIAGILDGISYGAAPALSTIVYMRSRKSKVGFNFGLFSAAFSGGAAFSPALGGWLARNFGIRSPFLFSFLMLTASALVCLYLRPQKLESSDDGVINALISVIKDRRFLAIMLLFMFLILLETTYDPYLSIYYREVHKLSYQTIGLLASMVFTINFFTSPLIGRIADKYGSAFALGSALTGYGLSLLFLGSARNFLHIFIALVGVGIFKQIYSMSSIATARNTGNLKPHIAYASLHFLRTSLSVFGPIIGGYIASSSIRAVFFFVSTLYLVVAAASFVYWKFQNKK